MDTNSLILDLITAIKAHLETNGDGKSGANKVLNGLKQVPLTLDKMVYQDARYPAVSEYLDSAFRNIPGSLESIAEKIDAAKQHLRWRVDRGHYYEEGAEVGAGYAEGNMHCELIGPDSSVSVLHADDFTLGLFLLIPRVFYRDHNRLASEFYFNLTGPTGWRFEKGPWQDYPADIMIWNDPYRVHATRVYDQPFLSVYSWTRDVREKCIVIPADDWSEIEEGLQSANGGVSQGYP